MDPSSLIEGGGLLAFAFAIWKEQRTMRETNESIAIMLAALLGPERVKALRRKNGRPLTPPPGIEAIENDRDSR